MEKGLNTERRWEKNGRSVGRCEEKMVEESRGRVEKQEEEEQKQERKG